MQLLITMLLFLSRVQCLVTVAQMRPNFVSPPVFSLVQLLSHKLVWQLSSLLTALIPGNLTPLKWNEPQLNQYFAWAVH
jgi:hypothetical protein